MYYTYTRRPAAVFIVAGNSASSFCAHFCHSVAAAAASFNSHIKRHQHLLLKFHNILKSPSCLKSRLSKHAFNCVALGFFSLLHLYIDYMLRMLMLTSMLLHFNKTEHNMEGDKKFENKIQVEQRKRD